MADDPDAPDGLPRAELNPLPRLLVRHAIIGFAASAVFTALLWVWGPKPLRDLLTLGPALLLWWACGLTFGSIQMGAMIMGLGRPEEPPPARRRPRAAAWLPVRVPARRR